ALRTSLVARRRCSAPRHSSEPCWLLACLGLGVALKGAVPPSSRRQSRRSSPPPTAGIGGAPGPHRQEYCRRLAKGLARRFGFGSQIPARVAALAFCRVLTSSWQDCGLF